GGNGGGPGVGVAGGGEHEDAAEGQQLHRRVERVGRVALRRVRAQREVDDADVQAVLVVEDEAEALDDVAHRRGARVVADLDVDQVRLRRHAGVLAARLATASGGEPGDVRAVAEAVDAHRRVSREGGDDA